MPNNPRAAENLTPFKPGQSGNPKGMPKGIKHLSTWINELMHDENFTMMMRDGLELKEYKGAPIKAIVGAQVKMAAQGDQKAFDLLGKYGFGTKLELANNPDNPINGTTDPATAAAFAQYLKEKK